MSEHYWISSGSGKKGPYTLSQLQNMWRTGSITADMLFLRGESKKWTKITEISHLLDLPESPNLNQHVQGQNRLSHPLKNPGIAAVLSFVFPGLGQVYNGNIIVGIVVGVLVIALYLSNTIFMGLVVHVYLIYESYSEAAKINNRGSN
jgi:TM2 domain-containing membrane protein YozV